MKMMNPKGVIFMNIKRYLNIGGFIILILLMTLIPNAVLARGIVRPVALFLGGEKVDPEIRVIKKNNYSYINLPFLAKFFPVISDWDSEQKVITFKFGELNFKMYEGRTVYYVNGSRRWLTIAPFARDGQVWLPLQFLLRLGLVIKSQDSSHLYLDWSQNYFLGVENITYEGRPAFLLAGTKKLKLKDSLLKEPNRLVIDLAGAVAHFALDEKLKGNSLVAKIGVNQISNEQLRLVFNLKKDFGYKIIQPSEQTNRAILVFNYLVEEVAFQQDSDRKVSIKTSNPAFYQVESDNDPHQLVINLKGATLTDKINTITGDTKWINAVHLYQTDPQNVKVVIDTVSSDPCFVVRSSNDPNLLEVRSFQQITAVNWIEADSGGKLIIQSNGEIINTIRKLHKPEQLQIELQCARFLPLVKIPEIKSDQVKGIWLLSEPSNTVKVVADLSCYAGYDVTTSADRRNLIVTFKKSPIIQKTIVLDAGHGGDDQGACGRQGTCEKEINLEVTMRVKDLLEGAGAQVILTRSNDDYISLYERAFRANYLFADLFISIHTNNHPDRSVQGIEVYHFPGRYESRLLAGKIATDLVRSTGLIGLGVKTNDFVVIRETQMPSILVELGYLSNYQEETIIKTTEFKDKAATGIFQGVLDYYQSNQLNLLKLSWAQ